MTLQASSPPTLSSRVASRTSDPLAHDAPIGKRSPLQRVTNAILFSCALSIASVLLAGCGSSLGRDNSANTAGVVDGGDWFAGAPVQPETPTQEPSPPEEPAVPPQQPETPIVVPPPSEPIQEQPTPPSPEEPSVPAPEPEPEPEPVPVVPISGPAPVNCGSGLAARDLAGLCRLASPTPGAFEASDGSSTVMASILSLAATGSASGPLQVNWQPFGSNTAGYLVYYGATANSVNVLVSDLALSSGLLNASAPSVNYDSASDLGMYVGDTVCFRVHAYDPARTIVDQVSLGCVTI